MLKVLSETFLEAEINISVLP